MRNNSAFYTRTSKQFRSVWCVYEKILLEIFSDNLTVFQKI